MRTTGRRSVAAGALQGERRRGIMLNLAAAIQLEDNFLAFEAKLSRTQSALVRYLGLTAQSVSDISLSCGLGHFKNSADKCQECQVIHTPMRIDPTRTHTFDCAHPHLSFAHAHGKRTHSIARQHILWQEKTFPHLRSRMRTNDCMPIQIGTFKDEADDNDDMDGCQPCPANSISHRAAINVTDCTEIPSLTPCGIRCDAIVILNDTDWTTRGYR